MMKKKQVSVVSATEKLQKVLARAGLGSRREIETWIEMGRVQINRQLATLGQRVGTQDEISVDGRKLRLKFESSRQIICYHKPAGEVCTRHDPAGRQTIFERLPTLRQGRWITVGRLDLNTSGLLLLTTDGELAHRLMHPSYQIEREYAVRILGEVHSEMLTRLRAGVMIEGHQLSFKQIKIVSEQGGANHWYHVILTEGRNHEVRRLWESQGVVVSRLIRVRFGPVLLPRNLRMGHYIDLDKITEQKLLQQVRL
jgi:23S rRNA pseudouridine2605 synthase